MFRSILKVMLAIGPWLLPGPADAEPLRFGVLNQRGPQLTAQYWNPILEHVSRKSSVQLELRMGKTAPESTAMAVRGEFDFAYTNHLFTTERSKLGWRVIARMAGDPIVGAIVVPEQSPIRTLAALQGKEVAFPSRDAFLGFWLPMDALLRSATLVTPLFAGNAEGAIGQLRAGAAAAAGVNAKVMAEFAEREDFRYRTIWRSEPYLDLAVMVHPRVAPETVAAVRAALLSMAVDAEGRRVLEASAALIKQKPPFGFVSADDKDYDNYRRFFRTTSVKPPVD